MDETPRDAAHEPPVETYQPVFNLAGVVTALIGIQVAIHALRVYILSDEQDYWTIVHGAFVPGLYGGGIDTGLYGWTAPITYSLLHASLPHLAINMIWLAAFGSPLANRIGTVRFLAFWVATALAAAGLHYVFHNSEMVPMVGASGAISGMMGAAARFAFRIDRNGPRPAFAGPVLPVAIVMRQRSVVTFLAVWFAINLVTGILGFMPGQEGSIAWEAHVGGFVAGFFGVGLFDAVKGRRPNGP